MLSRSLPANLFASYLHGFLSVQHAVSLPPSEAPSQRSSPQAISSVSCPSACCIAPSQRSSFPAKISASYFHVSSPSSMLSRSLPAKLSLSYLHSFLSVVQHAVSLPPSEAFRSNYFHGFPSIQHAASLPPSEALPKLFPERSAPQVISTVSYLSSMLSRSLPAKLSANYLHGFLSVSMLSRSLPAKLSASYPSSMLYRSLPAKLPASYFHGFLSVQHAVSLPPSEALCKLFPRFRLRPACCIAPSQRSSPQAISTVSSPSSMLSRSLPAKLSPAISTVSSPSSMLYRSLPAKLSAS